MEDYLVNANDLPWDRIHSQPLEMSRKILRSEPDGTPRVALIKLGPGFEMDAHTHAYAENHYVLEGMYEAQGREYPAGTYRFVSKDTEHGPFRSAGGAVLLVMWED